jgi:hypothetical protein
MMYLTSFRVRRPSLQGGVSNILSPKIPQQKITLKPQYLFIKPTAQKSKSNIAPMSVIPIWLLAAMPAIADDNDIRAFQADDPVISTLFSVAIVALSVITLGVAYLSFTSWNDSRLEKEDKERYSSQQTIAGKPKKKLTAKPTPSTKGFGGKK